MVFGVGIFCLQRLGCLQVLLDALASLHPADEYKAGMVVGRVGLKGEPLQVDARTGDELCRTGYHMMGMTEIKVLLVLEKHLVASAEPHLVEYLGQGAEWAWLL